MKSNLKKCFCSTLAGLVVCGAFCIPTHEAKADESNSENRYYKLKQLTRYPVISSVYTRIVNSHVLIPKNGK